MKPKLINGKVWIYVEIGSGGGYQKLPEDDPKCKEILLWIDSQRFVELLDWVYRQRMLKKLYLQTYRAEGFAFVLSQDAGNGAAVIVVQLFGAG